MLAALLLLMGCGEPLVPAPAGEAFTPPPAYAEMWAETEACSGHSGHVSRIEWIKVPADPQGLFTWNGSRVAGLWSPPHTIYLSEAFLDHAPLVRHEMLHDLLQGGGHPEVPFVTPCQLRWPVLIPIDTA